MDSLKPRVLIVADNASARFGGEAILPLHYFLNLHHRGIAVWLLTNARNRAELLTVLPPPLMDRVYFVPDTGFHRLLEKIARPLPVLLGHSVRFSGRVISQIHSRKLARQLIEQHQIDVVHQPIPVSPKESSLIAKVGAPVVIGPMNGGMTHPPGFERSQSAAVKLFYRFARFASHGVNRLMPGKLRAKILLVANDRTASALPHSIRGTVITLVENGVDLTIWKLNPDPPPPTDGTTPIRVIFSGRLVDWKGVQYLLPAFKDFSRQVPATLEILGDGVYRPVLEAQSKSLQLTDKVFFRGWMSQAQCATAFHNADLFVLPSLYECGGAVVLEAMACGLPVIATNWGGPADYLDPSTGILIDPGSPNLFVDRLHQAMIKLAHEPAMRRTMGAAGRAKVVKQFDWQRKIDRILEIYQQAKSKNP